MTGADNQEIGDAIEEAIRTSRKVKAGVQA
jgi:hypothetical protein